MKMMVLSRILLLCGIIISLSILSCSTEEETNDDLAARTIEKDVLMVDRDTINYREIDSFIDLNVSRHESHMDSFNVSYFPEQGLVPDSQTALKLAQTIWERLYGDEIYKYDYRCRLKDDSIWIVHTDAVSYPHIGGAVYIKIRKSDAKVLFIMSGK